MVYSKPIRNCRLCKGNGWFIMTGWDSIEAVSTSERCRCFCVFRHIIEINNCKNKLDM